LPHLPAEPSPTPPQQRPIANSSSDERRRLAGLLARADQQHRWVLAGDERGVYGEYPCPPL
jgi:hypothetical protein